MNYCNKFCHFYKILVYILLLTHFLFIVICNTESGVKSQTNPQTVISNVSSNGKLHHREPRSVHRGQNNYFQRGYEINRLRHEEENSLRAPRHKPFFHNVNEVYSYYLPKKFTKINSNIENFSVDKVLDNRLFDSKTRLHDRSMTRTRGEERFPLTRRVLPSADFHLTRDERREDSPLTSSQYQRDQQNIQRYRPNYQRNIPRIPSRRQPSISSGASYQRMSSSGSDSSALIPEPQSLVRNSTFPGIPGWQVVDFPNYSTVPSTGFRCAAQPYYGYYADVSARCQVFHVCQPDGREYSFLCPNGTLYHQKVQTCDWWWHVDCPSSPRFYYLNARIGVIPPVDSTLYRFPKTS